MELPELGLGVVRTRQVDNQSVQAQDVDRARSTPHPTHAAGGGAAAAGREPGLWGGGGRPTWRPQNTRVFRGCFVAPWHHGDSWADLFEQDSAQEPWVMLDASAMPGAGLYRRPWSPLWPGSG